jgi:hypothetical protein
MIAVRPMPYAALAGAAVIAVFISARTAFGADQVPRRR